MLHAKNKQWSMILLLAIIASGCQPKQDDLSLGDIAILPKPVHIMANDGFFVAASRTTAIIDDMVVLPPTPQTVTVFFPFAKKLNPSAWVITGIPFFLAATTSIFFSPPCAPVVITKSGRGLRFSFLNLTKLLPLIRQVHL